jgi:hypothetical protein
VERLPRQVVERVGEAHLLLRLLSCGFQRKLNRSNMYKRTILKLLRTHLFILSSDHIQRIMLFRLRQAGSISMM